MSTNKTVNGIQLNLWHSMSDERRSQYMREKRKGEAFKTELCKGFIRSGYCRYGEECRFAHFQEELRIHPKFKTELCRNYSMRGICVYGSRCQFIHRSPSKTFSDSDVGQRYHYCQQQEQLENSKETPVKTSKNSVESPMNLFDAWDPFSIRNNFTESMTFALSSPNGKKFARSCFPILSQKTFV